MSGVSICKSRSRATLTYKNGLPTDLMDKFARTVNITNMLIVKLFISL